MRNRTLLFLSIAMILLVIGIFQINVYGYEVNKTSGGAEIKWNTRDVTYYINILGGPTESLSAVQSAMQTWTGVNTSSFNFVYGGTTTSAAYGTEDGINIVVFGPMGTTGALAENTYWYYPDSGHIIDSDIKFNTDYTWNTDGSAGVDDVQNIGTHEFGHSLSLDNLYAVADSEKTMYYSSSTGETKKRTLHQDDIDGITYLYPTGSVSGTVSYSGTQTGPIYVAAFTLPLACSPPNPGEPYAETEVSSPGSYTISGLPDGTYYVASLMFTCGDDCEPQLTDPWGIYDGCSNIKPVVISGGSTESDIDINLVDGTLESPNPFSEPPSLLGDINNDGSVDISDVILVLRIALGLDPIHHCADINNDDSVDISDVILTLRMALGLDSLRLCTGFIFNPLEFPFKTPSDIARMAAFGIPNWSGTEPHNGIDLQISKITKIISPTNGTIKSIETSENPFSNPPNQFMLTIGIFINSEWSVYLVIEPSTIDDNLKNAQIAAVQVQVGQLVRAGDELTDLFVGDLGYPHLHYMVMRNNEFVCAYTYSSDAAKIIFNEIAATRPNNNLPDGNICYGQAN